MPVKILERLHRSLDPAVGAEASRNPVGPNTQPESFDNS